MPSKSAQTMPPLSPGPAVFNQPITSPPNPAAVPPSPPATQPDPTPFVAPKSPPPAIQGSSRMERIKKIAIIFAILILLGLLAGLVWFFVLGGKTKEPVKTESSTGAPVAEPSPPPKRTDGGFADLPPATNEASPGASPQLQSPVP